MMPTFFLHFNNLLTFRCIGGWRFGRTMGRGGFGGRFQGGDGDDLGRLKRWQCCLVLLDLTSAVAFAHVQIDERRYLILLLLLPPLLLLVLPIAPSYYLCDEPGSSKRVEAEHAVSLRSMKFVQKSHHDRDHLGGAHLDELARDGSPA